MKRRTIDLVISAGGLLLAVILLIGGLVLSANANFAADYVAQQMSEQRITFTALEDLSDEEKEAACLVEYAGQPMTTGKQAECYANNYIGLHLRTGGATAATGDAMVGLTYAEIGAYSGGLTAQRNALNEQIAALPADDPSVTALTEQRDTLNTQIQAASSRRETVFKGEMLRGVLLTSYGFSELGVKAGQGALVAYIGSGLMFLLAGLGFWHGFRTGPSVPFAAVEPTSRKEREGASA